MLYRLIAAVLALTSIAVAEPAAYQPNPGSCGTMVTPEMAARAIEMQQDGTWDIARNFLRNRERGEVTEVLFAMTIHIVRYSDGSGGLPTSTVNSLINVLNNRMSSTGITFVQEGPILYLDNDDFAVHDSSEFCELVAQDYVPNTMNIYFVPEADACGRASLPFSNTCQGVVVNNACANPSFNVSTFPHEVGHYLSLYHTHETAFGIECVSGSNCASAGDGLCDTPADPLLSGVVDYSDCEYFGTELDACGSGNPYTPDTQNLMSYSTKQCRVYFSEEQLSTMTWCAFNQRGSHLRADGVCCFQGNCLSVIPTVCLNAGGVWQENADCDTFDCNLLTLGACCLEDGSCLNDQTIIACDSANGTWQGESIGCDEISCPKPIPSGACCLSSLTCVDDYTSDQCLDSGGAYQGNDSQCSLLDCDSNGGTVEFDYSIVGTNLLSIDQENWTLDIYAVIGEGSRVDAIAGNSIQNKVLASTNGFYQDPNGGPTSADLNPNFYDFVPDLEWDSRVTIGALDQTGDPFDANNLGQIGINWDTFENGGTLTMDNGTWYVLPTDSQGDAQPFVSQDCSEKNGVLVARLTAMELDSIVSIEALIQARNSLDASYQEIAAASFAYQPEKDCNSNDVSDACDIANGTSEDTNTNGIPDECEIDCPGDADGDGDSDVNDILLCIGNYGGSGEGDVDNDGNIDVNDILLILNYFGGC